MTRVVCAPLTYIHTYAPHIPNPHRTGRGARRRGQGRRGPAAQRPHPTLCLPLGGPGHCRGRERGRAAAGADAGGGAEDGHAAGDQAAGVGGAYCRAPLLGSARVPGGLARVRMAVAAAAAPTLSINRSIDPSPPADPTTATPGVWLQGPQHLVAVAPPPPAVPRALSLPQRGHRRRHRGPRPGGGDTPGGTVGVVWVLSGDGVLQVGLWVWCGCQGME